MACQVRSSLVEQILSTHSQVEGLGELKDMAFSINKNSKKFTELREIEPSYYEKIGNDYIQSIEKNYNPEKIFVDKALMFSSIGFIKLALPNSKIILCKRNPKIKYYLSTKTISWKKVMLIHMMRKC